MRVYLLPGLAADRRLFDRIQLNGHEPVCIDWPDMPKASTIRDFATRMAALVDRDRPHALVGVSMGGMVAQEMAAITHPHKVVAVSSWKGPHEMPRKLRLLRGTHPERMVNKVLLYRVAPIMRMMRYQLGLETKDSQKLVEQMMRDLSIEKIKVQIDAALNWNGPSDPVPSLVHIHGDRDRLMPISLIKDPIVIRGGTHVMVFSNGPEVSTKLKEILDN